MSKGKLQQAAVIGGGVIGGGWVARLVQNGVDTVIFDPDPEAARKIDAIMAEAKLDVKLMNSLADSIKGLETSAKALSPATEAITASQTYSSELANAASHLEQLNLNYQNQLANSKDGIDFSDKVNENAEQLRAQMENLSANLAALNNVYGGMLNAMNKE